ncbi:peroxiredoxin-like family protein [Clostridium sp.]|uniref:peroxiredoxin-like family protein n=1 Tax=Clostridium sp. TaxID=1506 RepID=UPI001A36F055|nr:peroxiredoxin-like family protein [Clostridium sp.]MBK5241357.1 AhpC/TSA family protein [Clostridium sp.]
MHNMSLKEEIKKLKDIAKEKTPDEIKQIFSRAIKELQETGKVKGIKAGGRAPNFTLKDTLGNDIELYEKLKNGPVVLTFYRGVWCPYCNLQLRAYEDIFPQIQAEGAELIAISPQKQEKSISVAEKNNLTFKLLTDIDGETSEKYNILFEVPTYLREVYEAMGINLSEYNMGEKWSLPLAATFIIDKNALIRYSFVNLDYTERMEPIDILSILSIIK